MCIISLLSICISCTLNIKQSTGNCRGNSNKAQRDGSCIRLLLLFQKLDNLKIFGIKCKSVWISELVNFLLSKEMTSLTTMTAVKMVTLFCFGIAVNSCETRVSLLLIQCFEYSYFFSGGAYSLSEQIIIIDCPFCKFAMYVPFQRDYCAIFHIWDIFCKLIYDSLKKKIVTA